MSGVGTVFVGQIGEGRFKPWNEQVEQGSSGYPETGLTALQYKAVGEILGNEKVLFSVPKVVFLMARYGFKYVGTAEHETYKLLMFQSG